MSANPFITGAESAEPKFELGAQTAELCQSLAVLKNSVEVISTMDRRYQDQVFEALKPVISADKEGQGRYKAFSEMHENTQALQAGIKQGLDRVVTNFPGQNTINIEESDIRKILEGVSEENAEEKFASLKKIQDELGQYYHAFMKDRYEKFNVRGRIKNEADESAERGVSLTKKSVEEENVLGIKDERISLVLKKYSSHSRFLAETVSVLNSKAKLFEADNLEQMEENFKNFNRVVVAIKNTMGVEKKA